MLQGGITRKKGNVELIHYSVSSAIKLVIHYTVPEEEGTLYKEALWMDYEDFHNLVEIAPEFEKAIGLK